ncbi:MAG: ferritin [Thermoplasmata archaeon]|nr:ferritin [Thermoplasmata archaeon]
MDKKVCALMNDQINKEMYSAYLYLDFSNYYSSLGLDGFAQWYRVQAEEEMEHAMKFYDYLLDNDVPVTLEAIAKPDKKFEDPCQPLEAGLEHEKYVTGLIENIYTAAQKAKDYRSCIFLEWFITEQAEEEKNARDLITKMKLFGGDGKSLYHLDAEMLARTRD